MKNFVFVALVVLVLTPVLLSNKAGNTLENAQEDPYQKSAALYEEYCIGCHFDPNTFITKGWKFGKSIEDIYTSIRYGQEEIGMPSFGRTFSDDEALNLASYIVNKGREEDFKEQMDAEQIWETEKLSYRAELVIDGLDIPWGMTWLPDGDLLVTERSGTLYRYSGDESPVIIKGVPKVYQYGQGGLLDIELHPRYKKNGWIYITFSYYAGETRNDGGSTALMRAKLKGDELVDQEILWKATPAKKKGAHYGSRIEFDREGYLFLTIGDRGEQDNAQLISNYSGCTHRLNDDGSIPKDNPFVDTPGAVPSIYNYGHRNIQGLALHPATGVLWSHEHGPRGGDELNIEKPGVNYGWPEITYGINYNGTIITQDSARAGMEQPLLHWTPSIAPCGMDFVEGKRYPGWEESILVGSLRFKYVLRVEMDGKEVVMQERLLPGMGRVRNVKMGPDGYIYVALEKPGRIVRLIPV